MKYINLIIAGTSLIASSAALPQDFSSGTWENPLSVVIEADTSSVFDDSSIEQPLKLDQKASLFYKGRCDSGVTIETDFIVDVSWTGKKVHFEGTQNIDNFDATTIGGGRGRPITSNALFHHATCRKISDTTLCSYWYYGTVKATVTVLGANKGIEIGAYQPADRPAKMAAHVIETCARITRPDMPCPPPTGKICEIDPVSVNALK